VKDLWCGWSWTAIDREFFRPSAFFVVLTRSTMTTIESFENESSEYAPKWLAGELQGLYQVGVIAVQQKNFSHSLVNSP